MPSRTDHGSSVSRRVTPSIEDALNDPGPPTDDTPTIISRNTPAANADDPARGIRGRRLAHFELIEPIGVGGMAAVLRARDTQLDRIVALKVLPPEMAVDPENIRRFHQEARSAAKLDHENIARVFFCGEDQRLHFIAFEFVEGENLRTLIERRGRLPVGECLHYMIQVTAGLTHAAERGVVHRDIKPSNIIITPTGRAKLVDMGLARSLVRKNEDDLTQSGVTLGTFDYISPEQALEPRDADTRSDIYSLGCTLYHALTGRPPVPEGTAAKKLHHHQHVRPADPRDHVPGLPVEVVRVLDRMMAKPPEGRFQTPEQLMQALLAAAKKLGLAEVPDGLAVEASLPSPSAGRPLAWVALAGILVVGVVLLADANGPGPRRPSTRVPGPADKGDILPGVKDAVVGKKDNEKPPDKPPEATDTVVVEWDGEGKPGELAEQLAKHAGAAKLELVLDADLDLSPLGKGLLLRAGRQITVRSKRVGERRTVTLKYASQVLGDDRLLSALTLRAPRVMVDNVCFVIDAAEASDFAMRALDLPAVGQQSVSRCQFIQDHPPRNMESRSLASIHSAGKELAIRDCVFVGFGKSDLGGRDAIVLAGPTAATAEQCAFGPHSATFRIEGESDAASVTMKHCTVMLPPRRSALFDVAGNVMVAFDVSHSLVGRLPGDGDGAVLLRQPGRGTVSWKGADNAYHDLDGYWCRAGEREKARWADFRKLLAEGKGKDDSRLLLSPPWQSEPAAQLAALERLDLKDAFAVALGCRALRSQARPSTDLVGAGSLLGSSWLPASLPELEDKTEPGKRVLVVEKGATDNEDNGVFGSLEAAVSKARPGDVIAIRHSGELLVEPILLNRKESSGLTIRPARRFRPVIVLAEGTEADAALFRLHDGRLRLEGLEFRIAGGRARAQSIISLVGDGECVMSGCVATLARDGEGTVSLASLPAAGGVMRMPGSVPARRPEKGPRLALENCLVRGEGDLMWARTTRPAALEMKNTLAALSGSIYAAEYPGGDTAPPMGHALVLTMERVTGYLGGPLVRLKAEKGARATVPMECKASSSLIVAAGAVKHMILLEAPVDEDAELRGRFKFEGRKNGYGYGTPMAQVTGEEPAPMMMGPAKWKEMTGDEEGTTGVKFAPMAESSFTRMLPGSFTPPRDAADIGAKLAELPQPRL